MSASTAATPPVDATAADVLLRVENVVKHFPVQSGKLFDRDPAVVHAVDGVTLAVRRGETVGLVGETGCGKSTLARCITRLHDLTSGRVIFDGDDISSLPPRQMRPYRREMQMIFQDPYGSLNPKVLIADEPTTALDVTVQAQVLQVIRKMQTEFGTAVILITHDLGVVADVADEVEVMYAGAVMEKADLHTTFYANHHPYTEGLLLSLPAYGGERERLLPITGQPPSLINLPSGCPFHPRCPYVMDRCRTEVPPLAAVGTNAAHLSACWLPHDLTARNEVRRKVVGEPLPAQAEA